jgi:NitT/TauT family transport system substrate-binding protein
MNFRNILRRLSGDGGGASLDEPRPGWVDRLEFETMDVRKLEGYFLPQLLKKTASLPPEKGLRVIQTFDPVPLYAVLGTQGWKHHTEKVAENEFHIWFARGRAVAAEEEKTAESPAAGEAQVSAGAGPVPVVLQSATPVAYPVMLRMMESEALKRVIRITEYKVWEETEKHLGWIVNGKADISFSALLAVAKLGVKQMDVRLASVDVWDNFYLLTRGYEARNFQDLRGREIHMPLFENAPPARVTHYFMKHFGVDPEEFTFVYGKPFGRPEEIARKLLDGEIDTALLREPEASYVLVGNPETRVSLSYTDLWRELFPERLGLPNAGIVFKNSWYEAHPEAARVFLEEAEKAVDWVVSHPAEAAEMSHRAMGRSREEVQRFLQRVTFNHQPFSRVADDLRAYLEAIEGKEEAREILDSLRTV